MSPLRHGVAAGLMLILAASPGPAFAQFLIEGPRRSGDRSRDCQLQDRHEDQAGGHRPNGPFNVLVGNRGNNYVYGQAGGALEGLIALYQVTKDQETHGPDVWFADQMLLHRNDRFQKWTTFTGKSSPLAERGGTDEVWKRPFCGTEQGDVAGPHHRGRQAIARSPLAVAQARPRRGPARRWAPPTSSVRAASCARPG